MLNNKINILLLLDDCDKSIIPLFYNNPYYKS